jgi:membrane associated rhomboid family serine protease
MIPLRDDNPTTLRPIITVMVIVVCVLAFLGQIAGGVIGLERSVRALGFVPAELFGAPRAETPIGVPASLTLLTSMFLHGGWMHLLGNMLYLWIFGNNVEDAMGHGRFVGFYLLCGLAAALAQALPHPDSIIPMVGASGAISGVLGAYLLLYPHARVLVLIPLGFYTRLVHLPALFVLGLWFVLQFVGYTLADSERGGVAWGAHVGGFVAGIVLIPIFKRRGVPLFGRGR